MKIVQGLRVTSLLFLGIFFVYGFTNAVELSDIETAVFEEDYEKAERLAEGFIDSKPAKVELDEALYFLGLSKLRLERFEESRTTFDLLLSGFPREQLYDKALLGIIDSFYLEEQYERGLTVAEDLLKKSTQSEFLSLIYLKLARGNLKLGNWQKARGYLKKIIRNFPKSMEAHLAKQLLEEKQYFAVQVGAFLDRKRAESLVTDLKDKGEYAYIVETVDYQGRKFYRVRVGKFASPQEAQRLEAKLAQIGYPTRIYP